MMERIQTGNFERQKKLSLLIAAIALGAFVVCVALGFIPGINDALSGPPEYMRAITTKVAEQVASKTGGTVPVIVNRDENGSCKQLGPDSQEGDEYETYYLLTYSERLRSYCLTILMKSAGGAVPPDGLTLSQATGTNYGRHTDGSTRAVPIARKNTQFPSFYLAALHWRAQRNRADTGKDYALDTQSSGLRPENFQHADLSLTGEELRAEVAKRHDQINFLLTNLIGLTFCICAIGLWRLWGLFRGARQACSIYDSDLSFRTFLLDDANAVVAAAHKQYQARQAELYQQSRAENVLKHAHKEVRARLESLMEFLTIEDRARVMEHLNNGNVEQMEALAQELQGQIAQKSPVQRLTLLLESLKDYCTPEEFTQWEARSFEVLKTGGFREARDFVIHAHDELRIRAKAADSAKDSPEQQE